MVSGYSVSAGERAAITINVYCNRPTPTKEHVGRHDLNEEELRDCYPENFSFMLIMTYNDILGNCFRQELIFKVTYYLDCTNESKCRYQCDIHLIEVGIPEKVSEKKRFEPIKKRMGKLKNDSNVK